MVEIEVSPASCVGKAFGILDGHVGAVESAGEITPPRGLSPRAVRIFRGAQCQLEFLNENRTIRKRARFLIDRVRSRLDVDIVKFRKISLATIERVRSEWLADPNPLTPIRWQLQFAGIGILRQFP